MGQTQSGLNSESVLVARPSTLCVTRFAHVHDEYGVLCDFFYCVGYLYFFLKLLTHVLAFENNFDHWHWNHGANPSMIQYKFFLS